MLSTSTQNEINKPKIKHTVNVGKKKKHVQKNIHMYVYTYLNNWFWRMRVKKQKIKSIFIYILFNINYLDVLLQRMRCLEKCLFQLMACQTMN